MTLSPEIAGCVPTNGPLRSYLDWVHTTTDAEHLFHLGSILPCVSQEAVRSGFVIDEQRRNLPTLWSFLIGIPGGAKSTAQRKAQSFYKSYLATQAGKAVDDPFVQAEGSWPGIFMALADRWDPDLGLSRGVFTRDEAARLLENKDTTIADELCRLMDNEEIKRHLRSLQQENKAKAGSAKDTLRSPAFSGCLATTFARIREVTQASFVEGGLYSRFIWFVGPNGILDAQLEMNNHEEHRRQVLDEWLDWGKWLLGMSALKERSERVVTFTAGARDLLRDTLFAEYRELAKHGDDKLNATRRRGLIQSQIIAGVWALTQQTTIVDAETMQQGINLIRLSTHGLETLSQKFIPTQSARDPVTLLDRAWDHIRASHPKGCTRSSLYQRLQCQRNVLDSIFETLVDEGSIELVPKPKGAGRPTSLYRPIGDLRYGRKPLRSHLIVLPGGKLEESVIVGEDATGDEAGGATEPPQSLDGETEPR